MDTLFLGILYAVPGGNTGFFVENQREHYVEHKREKQYIQSFYEDLTADEDDLEANINYLRRPGGERRFIATINEKH